uniref:MATH domain-containing protein n=1 Tax=Strongyloides papillosus TaxID=174720 RepID=A0A0N5CA67_STREA
MDSKDLHANRNIKNTVIKRASFIRTIENFPISWGFPSTCSFHDFNAGKRCGYGQACQKCRERELIAKNGHTSKFEMNHNVKCSLGIYPNCINSGNNGYVSLCLEFTELNRMEIMALCKFSILNVDGKDEFKSVLGVKKFNAHKSSYCLQRFIKRDDLREKKSIVLPDDRLTVCFEIFYLFCDGEYISGVSETTHIVGPFN